MNKEKLLYLWKIIENEFSKRGLLESLDMYELTIDDWDSLEHEIYKLANTLEEFVND